MSYLAEPDVASALMAIASAINYLGNGNAASPMGAIENLAKEIKQGCEIIADSISELAEAVDRLPLNSGEKP